MFEQYVVAENAFLRDVRALHDISRQAMLAANIPESGREPLSRQQAARSIDLLQSVLAAEIICVLRYSLLAISEDGLKNDWLATEFTAQANDERRHMAMLAKRIEALGGVPNFSPAGLSARMAELGRSSGNFALRLQQNLAAEQCVVDHYRELATFFDRHDPESAAVLNDILQDEEDHCSDMQDLLISCLG